MRSGMGRLGLVAFAAFASAGCPRTAPGPSPASVPALATDDALPLPGPRERDAQPPAVQITRPTAAAAYASASPTLDLSGLATDNVGVRSVSWRNDRGGGGGAQVTGSPLQADWAVPGVALQAGANVLTVSARDGAGREAVTTLRVYYGTDPAATYYLSPTGGDSNDGRSPARAWKSFAHAFAHMAGGDELVLLDGVYSAAAGTGTMQWDNGPLSAQPPSGSRGHATYVHALNPGAVTIDGPLFLGRSTRKDSWILLQGLRFEGMSELYNTAFVTLKDDAFHGGLSLGTNDHANGVTDNLVEDSWVWASGQRGIAMNYRAHRNVWRRVVVRGDGCGRPECQGSGNPNIGFTVYDSHDVSVQNMLVIDRVLKPGDEPYADFAAAQHTADPQWFFGRNEWLGTMSLNSPDLGYYLEPDAGQTVDPTIHIANAVAFNAAHGGFDLSRYGTHNVLENLTASTRADDAVRIAPELEGLGGALLNVLVFGTGRYGVNSAYGVDYVNASGSWSEGAFNQGAATHVLPGDARANGSLKYLTRIEPGSPLKGAGTNGADVGATVLSRVGADGRLFGEPGYNATQAASLWPWPNEDRIRRDLCEATTRGFCTAAKRLDGVNPVTLTSYVWEALGNPLPSSMYPRAAPVMIEYRPAVAAPVANPTCALPPAPLRPPYLRGCAR